MILHNLFLLERLHGPQFQRDTVPTKRLEPFSFRCSDLIAGVADIVSALRRGDGRQGRSDRRPQVGHRAGRQGSQVRFEFGKDLFNGIEVRTVRRQIEELGADGFNRLADPGHFMARQIVQDDPVARLQRGGEDLFDIRDKGGAIKRAVKDGGGGEVVGPQRRNDRRRLPVAMRDFGHEAGPAPTPAIAARHLRLDRGLVQEDETGAVEVRGLGAPVLAGRLDIRPILFGGAQDFFLLSGPGAAQRARPW